MELFVPKALLPCESVLMLSHESGMLFGAFRGLLRLTAHSFYIV